MNAGQEPNFPMHAPSLRMPRPAVLLLLLSNVVPFLSGCIGVATAPEKLAREQAQAVAAEFRPHGEKPALPVLTADSTLSELVTFALLNQPQVEAAYYEWLASIERITRARSLPDPQLTFQMDIQSAVTSVMPGLMMNFPGYGKLQAGAEIATAESEAKFLVFKNAALLSAYQVRRAYYQLYFLEQKILVSRENLRLALELEQLAKAQNEVGKGSLQDVLRAQIETERLKTVIVNLEDSTSAFQAEMKAALGLGQAQLTPPLPKHFEMTASDLPLEQLLNTAYARNTRLQALQAEVLAAEAAITLAERSQNPDLSFGLMADAKTAPIMYRPLASLSLPIWRDKVSAQIAEAQAAKQASEARLSSEQIAFVLDFATRTVLLRQAERNLALLKTQLIPKAQKSFAIGRSAYLSGQIDFFNLADSERTLLALKLEQISVATQRELLLTEFSLLADGLSLPAAADSTAVAAEQQIPGMVSSMSQDKRDAMP